MLVHIYQNFIKMEITLTNSLCLKDFGIYDCSELKELAIIENGYMNAIQGEWPFLNT